MRLVVIAGAIAAIVSLIGTPLLIRILARHGYAQAIRVSTDGETYPDHEAKIGTPSMGGVAIIMGVVLGYFLTHLIVWRPLTPSGLLILYLMIGLGLVGVADDYLKIFKQRSTGLRARTKLIGQAVVAFSFAYLAVQFPNAEGVTPASTAISFLRDTGIVLPMGLFLLWIWFLITATTNGVNLTDGLDGLATGAAFASFLAYVLISIWQYGQSCFFEETSTCYTTANPIDLAIVAAAAAGVRIGTGDLRNPDASRVTSASQPADAAQAAQTASSKSANGSARASRSTCSVTGTTRKTARRRSTTLRASRGPLSRLTR
jgi:phospho-N-acetylmuramoyl-pentapeptide-transferase